MPAQRPSPHARARNGAAGRPDHLAGGRRQPASLPSALTSRSRRSAAARAAAAVTTMSSSPCRSTVRGVGHERLPVADHQGDVGPARQPQLEHLDPVQGGARPDADGDDVGVQGSERRALDVEPDGRQRPRDAAEPRHPAAGVGPCTRVRRPRARPRRRRPGWRRAPRCASGIVASTIGTAPRSPAQDEEGLLAPRHAEPRDAGHHAEAAGRRAAATRPSATAGSTCPGSRAGSASSPSSTNSPIWAIQPMRLGEAPDGGAVRQPRVAEDERGEVRREEARPVQDVGGPEGGDRQRRARAIGYSPDDGSATRRSSTAPASPTARPTAAPTASSISASPSSHHHGCGRCRRAACSVIATTRMTTGASLNPDSASSRPASRARQRDRAQHGEDRRGVGRGDDGAEQQRARAVEPEDEPCRGGGHDHRHQRADRRRAPPLARPTA